jgi:signal transduction histidine kinase
VRRRIFLTIVAIAALVITAFGVPLGVAIENSFRDETRLGLQRTAAAAAADVPRAFATSGAPVELVSPDPDASLALYDVDGRRHRGRGPDEADEVVRRAFAGASVDGMVEDDIVVAFPVVHDEVIVGAVRAALPEEIVDWRAVGAGAAMAGLAVVVLSAATAVALWQTRRLTRPLDRLTLAAGRLGDGDFTVRNVRSGLAEVDATAEALDRTAERLGRLMERERAFSADVSHQLRTPLTGLRLELENALSTPGVDMTGAVEAALGAIDRLEATIEDLLALARDMTADHGPVDVAAVLGDLDERWRTLLAGRDRRLVVGAADGLGEVRFSDAALRQALDVLVANSAEHGAGTVTVTAAANGSGVAIEVGDEGPGIRGDPERAFARRADRRVNRGIGLALARTLVEAEGGSLVYRAAPRPRFSLTIPTAEPAPCGPSAG